MKLKLKQEITNSTPEELKKRLVESRKAFQQGMLDHKQFKLKNTSSLTTIRREIAVILTVIKEKEAQNHGQNA